MYELRLSTGNLRLARKVAPKGERENELLFSIIAAQSILAPYALIWPALLKQPAGEILSEEGGHSVDPGGGGHGQDQSDPGGVGRSPVQRAGGGLASAGGAAGGGALGGPGLQG